MGEEVAVVESNDDRGGSFDDGEHGEDKEVEG